MGDMTGRILVEGLEEQIQKLQGMDEDTTKEFKTAVAQGNQVMKRGAQERVKVFTGSTKGSIRTSVRAFEGRVYGITGPAKSGKSRDVLWIMQEGRKVGSTQPWIYDVMDWVIAKFHPEPGKEKQTAYAVATSIQQKGTKGFQVFRPVMEANKGIAIQKVYEAVQRIVEKLRV